MNIAQIRAATPGTRNVIHFNNAGASLMPEPVSTAIINYLQEETSYGGYETAHKRSNQLEEVYSAIADFINADADEIAILENATAAWNMAFFAIDFQDGDRILTSMAEYASNYINYLKLQKSTDVEVEVIPSDEHGQVSISSLEEMIDESVKLISITHIPTNSGLVNPVEKIGTIARQHNCLYLVDACQSVGQYPIDVQTIGCDMLLLPAESICVGHVEPVSSTSINGLCPGSLLPFWICMPPSGLPKMSTKPGMMCGSSKTGKPTMQPSWDLKKQWNMPLNSESKISGIGSPNWPINYGRSLLIYRKLQSVILVK